VCQRTMIRIPSRIRVSFSVTIPRIRPDTGSRRQITMKNDRTMTTAESTHRRGRKNHVSQGQTHDNRDATPASCFAGPKHLQNGLEVYSGIGKLMNCGSRMLSVCERSSFAISVPGVAKAEYGCSRCVGSQCTCQRPPSQSRPTNTRSKDDLVTTRRPPAAGGVGVYIPLSRARTTAHPTTRPEDAQPAPSRPRLAAQTVWRWS